MAVAARWVSEREKEEVSGQPGKRAIFCLTQQLLMGLGRLACPVEADLEC
jgi:hypothetical protein